MKKLALAMALACCACAPLKTTKSRDSMDNRDSPEHVAAREAERIALAEAEAKRLFERNETLKRIEHQAAEQKARNEAACDVARWPVETCIHALCELRHDGGWVLIDRGYCEPLTRAQILDRLLELKPAWGASVHECLKARSVRIGFDTEQVLASWGRPSDVNRTTTAHSVSEQWAYEIGAAKNTYLYFDDGVLTAIQD